MKKRRTPHGVRELKHEAFGKLPQNLQVAPHTGCVN